MPPSDDLHVLVVPPLACDGWMSIERYADAIESAAAAHGVRVSRARTPRTASRGRMGNYGVRYRRYPEALLGASESADAVHIPDQALGHLVPRFTQATVVTCHDLMPLFVEGHYHSRFEAWFDRHLLARSLTGMLSATRIVAVSEATRSDLIRLLDADPERIDVVPNVVGDVYHAAAEPRDDLPGGPRVLSVGRAAPYKNLEATLVAVASVPGTQLIRVGQPLTTEQRALAGRLGLEGRITELGYLEPAELAGVYASCDLLLQPSLYEGFGVPVIEAMACGLPVVCSDGGALGEVAGAAAMVVPLSSDDFHGDLSVAVQQVLSEPATASMLGARGLDRAAHFRPANVFPRLLAVYRAALEEQA